MEEGSSDICTQLALLAHGAGSDLDMRDHLFYLFILIFSCKVLSYYIVKADLKLAILLLQPPQCNLYLTLFFSFFFDHVALSVEIYTAFIPSGNGL